MAPAEVVVNWHDILLTFRAPQHMRYCVMMLVTLAITLLFALSGKRKVALFYTWCLGMFHGLVTWAAWHQVMVQLRESNAITVHCIWFNGLLALTYLLVLGFLTKDSLAERLKR